jgi:hypothetical protein
VPFAKPLALADRESVVVVTPESGVTVSQLPALLGW